jgi:hypothetical protein
VLKRLKLPESSSRTSIAPNTGSIEVSDEALLRVNGALLCYDWHRARAPTYHPKGRTLVKDFLVYAFASIGFIFAVLMLFILVGETAYEALNNYMSMAKIGRYLLQYVRDKRNREIAIKKVQSQERDDKEYGNIEHVPWVNPE